MINWILSYTLKDYDDNNYIIGKKYIFFYKRFGL